MNTKQTALADLMSELSEKHTSASWVIDWEHLLWDAMRSDGTFVNYEDGPEFQPDELAQLRQTAAAAGGWCILRPDDNDQKALLIAMGVDPTTLDESSPGEPIFVDPALWQRIHEGWLRTPNGRTHFAARRKLYAETGRTFEELADLRDRLADTIRTAYERISAPHFKVMLDVAERKAVFDVIEKWLPAELKTRYEVRRRRP